MNRRTFLCGLTLGALTAPIGAEGQPSTTIPPIGLLAPDATSWKFLKLGLRDLGYVEGKSIAFEERSSQGRNERLSDLASELVRLKVNVIVTLGRPRLSPSSRRRRLSPSSSPALAILCGAASSRASRIQGETSRA